jgi:hypothetical protein
MATSPRFATPTSDVKERIWLYPDGIDICAILEQPPRAVRRNVHDLARGQ